MAGPVSICCCDIPEILEEKQIAMSVPFPGFTQYISNTDHSTAWETRHYLTRTIVSTDVYGLTQTSILSYDQDNGSLITNSTTTDPGYAGNTGIVLTTTHDATHITEVWYDSSIPAYGGRVYTLSDPYDLDDLIDTWRTRFDAIMATDDMLASTTLSARRGVYSGFGGTASDTVSAVFDFFSFGTSGGYSQIYLSPWKGWVSGAPGNDAWDSTYFFQTLDNYYSVSSIENSRSRHLGQSPGLGDSTYIGYGLPSWDGSQFSYTKVVWVLFLKTCISLPTGLDCGQVDYETDTNYELGDVVLTDFDYSTGLCTQTSTELQLSPGYYSFDGRQMVIHSGRKIYPTTDVVGIDGITDPYYGCSSPRIAVITDGHSDSRMVADYCP